MSIRHIFALTVVLTVFLSSISTSHAQTTASHGSPIYGAELEGFDYAYPVHNFEFDSQGEKVHMAYLDIPPSKSSKPNHQTALLLHGKLFCADTWRATIKALADNGFRVIAPDQIGFCKSTKPERYQYSFQQLASNTRALLKSLGITRSVVVGHSMGGMLATRYALMYPQTIDQLALINPLGLEDWKALGVPYANVDQYYASELKTNAEDLKKYQRSFHYNGEWRPEFDRWVEMLAGMYRGPGLPLVARNAALTYDMIYSQPVFYEFEQLSVPTILFIGLKDKTAITNGAPSEVRARLADYPTLGKSAAARIPNVKLVEFDDLAHSPQIQAPERFNQALLKALSSTK